MKLLVLYKTAKVGAGYGKMYEYVNTYTHKFDNVDSYFLICDQNIDNSYEIEGRNFIIKAVENNWETLLVKVLTAFAHFKDADYTHIFVCNISTFVNIPYLYSMLDHCPCKAFVGEYKFKDIHYTFPSGAGYLLTIETVRNICDFVGMNEFIINNKFTDNFLVNYPSTDDIFMGYYFNLNNIAVVGIPRIDIGTPTTDDISNITRDISHIRIKSGNLDEDFKTFYKLMSIFYKE